MCILLIIYLDILVVKRMESVKQLCHFKAQTHSQNEKPAILSDALYSHFPCDMKYLGIAVSLKMRGL